MEANDKFREDQRKRYLNMRMVKDIMMSFIFLCVGLMMFFGKKFLATRPFFENKEPVQLELFGGLCLLYGCYRMYIAVKRRY